MGRETIRRHQLLRYQNEVPKQKTQKDTIIYNNQITISEIPAKAYEYVVNGKICHRMDNGTLPNYHTQHSGITNNPNDWATEVGNSK